MCYAVPLRGGVVRTCGVGAGGPPVRALPAPGAALWSGGSPAGSPCAGSRPPCGYCGMRPVGSVPAPPFFRGRSALRGRPAAGRPRRYRLRAAPRAAAPPAPGVRGSRSLRGRGGGTLSGGCARPLPAPAGLAARRSLCAGLPPPRSARLPPALSAAALRGRGPRRAAAAQPPPGGVPPGGAAAPCFCVSAPGSSPPAGPGASVQKT